VTGILSDKSFMASFSEAIPTFAGSSATPDEIESIAAARAGLPGDAWVASRSDEELLPFARSCDGSQLLAERLAESSAWRAQTLPGRDDESWEFDAFFQQNAGSFLDNPEQPKPFFEWVRASDGDGGASAPMQLDGASLLILRPGRHKVGAVDSETWLRLIAWHGERATTEWARQQRDGAASEAEANEASGRAAGRGAITLIVDRQGSGLRNQDPALLRALLPPLTRHFPYSLHRAYVAPVNVVFYAIWKVARLVLPKAVTDRFTLLRGADWKQRLREELGPEVSARLPDNL